MSKAAKDAENTIINCAYNSNYSSIAYKHTGTRARTNKISILLFNTKIIEIREFQNRYYCFSDDIEFSGGGGI